MPRFDRPDANERAVAVAMHWPAPRAFAKAPNIGPGFPFSDKLCSLSWLLFLPLVHTHVAHAVRIVQYERNFFRDKVEWRLRKSL